MHAMVTVTGSDDMLNQFCTGLTLINDCGFKYEYATDYRHRVVI